MIKPASLRAHLVAALPDLARDADRLLVFIDAGSLVSTFQPGLSFEYQYTLNLILTDYAGHPDSVMLPLLEWVQANQSELLSNTARRGEIAFEADILANDAVDLSIKLP
ncbi:phage tail protein, partial [Xanthomonas arboricola pv. corylina]